MVRTDTPYYNDLQARLFAHVVGILEEESMLLKKESIVDSSLIAAPPSTKNAERSEIRRCIRPRKVNAWCFGYKAHTEAEGSDSSQQKGKRIRY